MEILKIAAWIYWFGFSLLTVIQIAMVVLNKLFPNWVETHVALDYDKTGHPPECLDCNESGDTCNKSLRCKLFELKMVNCC